MKRVLAIAFACGLAFPPGLWAQESLPDSDWNSVTALKINAKVKVRTRDGRRLNGTISRVDTAGIVLGTGWGRRVTLGRNEIQEVRMRHRVPTIAYAALGTLAGFGAGTVWGRAACGNPCYAEKSIAIVGGQTYGMLLGAISGFGVSAAVNARPGRLIYRAPRKG